jgi:hypothetical protein
LALNRFPGSRSPGYPAGSDGQFGPTSKKELWNNMDTAGWWTGMKYRITAEGVLETGLSGFDLINFPMLNKGTAFTEEERTDFALHGLLPPHVGNLEDQAARRLKALRDRQTDFGR